MKEELFVFSSRIKS